MRWTRSWRGACSRCPMSPADVDVDVAEDLPLVLADPGLLERVLVNVLDNALRHGGGSPVEVRAFAGAGSAKMTRSPM